MVRRPWSAMLPSDVADSMPQAVATSVYLSLSLIFCLNIVPCLSRSISLSGIFQREPFSSSQCTVLLFQLGKCCGTCETSCLYTPAHKYRQQEYRNREVMEEQRQRDREQRDKETERQSDREQRDKERQRDREQRDREQRDRERQRDREQRHRRKSPINREREEHRLCPTCILISVIWWFRLPRL